MLLITGGMILAVKMLVRGHINEKCLFLPQSAYNLYKDKYKKQGAQDNSEALVRRGNSHGHEDKIPGLNFKYKTSFTFSSHVLIMHSEA